jgi:HAD superfamily hydrolase (TIGR01662 family)
VSRASQTLTEYDLYLFDLDGTLIEAYMDAPDPNEAYSDVIPLQGRPQVLQALREVGKWVAVITNQAGIDFGYIEPEVWTAKMSVCAVELGIDQFFVCYGHPNGMLHKFKTLFVDRVWDPERRKPNPWMIFEAMQHFQVIDFKRVVYIGDMDSDRQCAENAGVDYIDAEDFFA